MNPPFEGLLGDTAEVRLLHFLLPMYGIDFTMAELVEEIGLTRQSIAGAIKKFADRGMVKIGKEGRTPLYSINENSPLVKCLEDFDNALIESMVGPEIFGNAKKEPAKITRISGTRAKIAFHPQEKGISGVASRSGSYVVKRKPARRGSTVR